ncbi:MAG TPA: acyl carrier protein, partial [Polyangiales bacterium]
MLEVHDRRAIAPESDAHAQVWERVCAALRVCAPGARQRGLDPATLLIDELGLDSLKFVDLTVALEDALGIHEFPMQEWVDEELSA